MRNKEYYKKIYNLNSWKGIHVGQLAYTRNLVIILATASLGFSLTLLFDKKLTDCEQLIATKTTCGLLLASVFCGLLIAILESENYRLKYKIGRKIESCHEQFENLPTEIERLQNKCTSLESKNRILNYVQLILFFTAMIILTITFM
ncbi:hypothetical protein [Peijinzhouia sedimentorum]